MLRCPVCQLPLTRSGRSYRCPKEHAFDIARSGYINLLCSHRRSRRRSGDSSEMVRSRRAFLEAGHYAPLGEELARIAHDCNAARFLDAGCGEGFLTARFVGGLRRPPREASWGIDISRVAVDLAAKRYQQLMFAVASVHRLPILDGSVTCLLNAFAPSEPREFRRVLDPAGTVVTIRPGEYHLLELRRHVYRKLHPPGRATAVELPIFEPVERRDLRFRLKLQPADVRNLLGMTPYGWRAGADAQRAILGLDSLNVTADFRMTTWRRRADLVLP